MILDQFGGLISQRQKVYDQYHKMLPLIDELKKLKTIRDRQAEHLELLQFQHKEISDAGIVAGEDIELEQERLRLKNSETLYQTVHGSIEELYGAPGSVIERLLEVKKNLERAGQIDPQLNSRAGSLSESTYLIEDLIEELRSYLRLIQIDEQRLETSKNGWMS